MVEKHVISTLENNHASTRNCLVPFSPQGAIEKVKSPPVLWVSAETTRQTTLYVPGGKFGTETASNVLSFELTVWSPLSISLPRASNTRNEEKAGSIGSENHSFTCAGVRWSVLPTAGSAWSRKA